VIVAPGGLYCWGANSFGQLGLGDQDPREAPTRVGSREDWQAISAGRFHSCGLRAGGLLECWGASSFGQAAQTEAAVLSPSIVAAPSSTWSSVSAGQWHTCALTAEGEAYCWGYNLLGRLGDGTGAGTEEDPEANVATPELALAADVTFRALSAGSAHTCAIDELGGAWCWGSGEDGRLGLSAPDECTLDASSVPCALTPEPLDDGRTYRPEVSAGGAHTCAIDEDGVLLCWGDGSYGQLGIGELSEPLHRDAPAALEGEYEAVAAGGAHTCAIASDGHVACFGDGTNGQLGSGLSAADEPAAVTLEGDAARVAAGAVGGCAITNSSDGYCWGFSAYADSNEPEALFQ
jgi:alpha-tubulin suppressor-like RCC1 family protein